MTNSKNDKRPLRKLTVKNFSVIKDAELEFGKITVLIGPQSSGKSLLYKLAYFLGKELVELAVRTALSGMSWDEYLKVADKEFTSWFYLGEAVSPMTIVEFRSLDYFVSLSWSKGKQNPRFTFSPPFELQYAHARQSPTQVAPAASGAFSPSGFSSIARQEEVWIHLNSILSGKRLIAATYVPAGRAFFTNSARGFALFQNPSIDAITREFAAYIQWESRWKAGLLTSGRGITDEINRFMTQIAKGFVLLDSGVPHFLSTDGRKLPLEATSTGVQEMLPLFNVLEQLMYFREHRATYEHATFEPPRPERPASSRPLIYLEEPEANVFPATQYDLVCLFAWLSKDPLLDFSWAISTHSPYVLSVLGDLVKAGEIGSSDPRKRDAVARVIPERCWIRKSDFAAFKIDENGLLASIFDTESVQIDGDYLDNISGKISDELGQLLEIQYGR